MRILGIAGSLRTGSYNRALLNAAAELAPDGMHVDVWDRLGDIPHYNADLDNDESRPAVVDDFKGAIGEADGVLVVSPEYIYGVPGVLKNALDWASRPPNKSSLGGKPAGVMGASTSLIGTARAQVQLRDALFACMVNVMPYRDVAVGMAKDKFADGRLTDEKTRDFVREYLRALADFVSRVAGGS